MGSSREHGAALPVEVAGDSVEHVDEPRRQGAEFGGVGANPRHLVMDPAGDYLYATLNGDGKVAKIDLDTEDVVDRVSTGDAPRSMAISDDGEALYVVNYRSDTMSKVLTEDFDEVQEISTGHHPIGVDYDPATDQVWVSNYSGSIMVFQDEPVGSGSG